MKFVLDFLLTVFVDLDTTDSILLITFTTSCPLSNFLNYSVRRNPLQFEIIYYHLKKRCAALVRSVGEIRSMKLVSKLDFIFDISEIKLCSFICFSASRIVFVQFNEILTMPSRFSPSSLLNEEWQLHFNSICTWCAQCCNVSP